MRELPPSWNRASERGGRDLTVAALRLGAMGDILRTLPPVRLLRQALPEARILWITEERWTAVVDGHPDLDGVVAVPRKQWRESLTAPWRWPALLGSVARFRRALRSERIDLVLDFHGNLRSGIASRMTGAPLRLGYSGHQQKEGNHLLSTHHVPSGPRRTSRMERNLSLVGALGIPTDPLPPADPPLAKQGIPEANRVQDDLGLQPGRYAVISPGASAAQAYKTPPAELLAVACTQAAQHGIPSLVVYGPGEEELARAVVERAGDGARLGPTTTLAALAALIGDARLFIGGDSGPLHLACATGCPVIGIYGPTDPKVNEPWGVPHRTVYPRDRDYTGIKSKDRTQGFEGIEPGQIEQAVNELLTSD